MTNDYSGKSESVTITNEKGRLSPEEIERMVKEAEDFAAEDEAQRQRIEALNSLSTFVYGLKTQLGDQEGLGGKLDDADKKTILDTVKETTDWIDDNGQSASAEELEEKLNGEYPHTTCARQSWVLMSCVQRCKVLSTPSRASFTPAAALHSVRRPTTRTTRSALTMSCNGFFLAFAFLHCLLVIREPKII